MLHGQQIRAPVVGKWLNSRHTFMQLFKRSVVGLRPNPECLCWSSCYGRFHNFKFFFSREACSLICVFKTERRTVSYLIWVEFSFPQIIIMLFVWKHYFLKTTFFQNNVCSKQHLLKKNICSKSICPKQHLLKTTYA